MNEINENNETNNTNKTNKTNENNETNEINQDNKEECIELKNIQFKTMLMTGIQITQSKSFQNLNNLDKFLEDEKISNENEPWCKLNKTLKLKKLLEYVDLYKNENELTDEECEIMVKFLKDCLDRKKLQRIKDVIYDKDSGIIKSIPALTFVKVTKHFTLKNIEKRVSTVKALPQKKGHGTIKNKSINFDE
jgi:hypothetical protein